MTRQKVFRQLVRVGHEVFQKYRVPGRPACILATAVTIDVLARFGIKGEPLSVYLDIINKPFADMMAVSGGQATAQELFDCGGRALKVGYPDDEPGTPSPHNPSPDIAWHGHLVTVVEQGGRLIDLEVGTFSRPEKDIDLPPAASFVWRGNPFGVYEMKDGSVLRYTAKPDDRSYESAIDWRERDRLRPCIDDMARAIRKGTA